MKEITPLNKPTNFSDIPDITKKEEVDIYDPMKNIIDRYGIPDYYKLTDKQKEYYWDAGDYGKAIRLCVKYTKGWHVKDIVNSKDRQCSEYRLEYVQNILSPLFGKLSQKQVLNPETRIEPHICEEGFTTEEIKWIVETANYTYEPPQEPTQHLEYIEYG